MSNEIHVIMFDKQETRLEMRFDGDDFHTAVVKFELKNKIGLVTGACMPIPVKSLFDITQLITVSIQEKTIRTEQYIQSTRKIKKEHKHGTKENKKK